MSHLIRGCTVCHCYWFLTETPICNNEYVRGREVHVRNLMDAGGGEVKGLKAQLEFGFYTVCSDMSDMDSVMQKGAFRLHGTVKAQIRLRKCAVWSGPSLSTIQIIGYYRMESNCLNETLPMCRMMWICTFWACSEGHFRLAILI